MNNSTRWAWILSLLLALTAVIFATVQEEIEPLLKSRPRKWYASDEKFGQAITEFHAKVFNHEAHRRLKHHVILRYDPAVSCIQQACLNILHEHFHEKKVSYISPHHAIVMASAEEINAFRTKNPLFLQDASPFLPSMKVDDGLLAIDCSSETGGDPIMIVGELPYMSQNEYDMFVDSASRVVNRFNGVVTMSSEYPDSGTHRIVVLWTINDCSLVASMLPLLAALREVLWLERRMPMKVHNRWAKGLMETGNTYYAPLQWSGNFTGAGEVIGVVDTGLDMMNCYLYDPDNQKDFQYQTSTTTQVLNPNHRKVLQYITLSGVGDTIDNDGGHGTHVAGIAAGECYAAKNYGDYKKFNGMAPGAKIAFMDLNVGAKGSKTDTITAPSNINTNVFTPLYKAGARVITNSWGNTVADTGSNSPYNALSKNVDEFMFDNPDALVIFSAGNSGYKSAARTVSPPGTAKSCLTVGASGNDYDSWRAIQGQSIDARYNRDLVAYFSSIGPTDDSRLKPEVMAPGFFTVSAKGVFNSTEPFCDYQILDGTSMAAPTVAGYAIIVRQYFTNGYYPSGQLNKDDAFTPSGALLKAMLVHSGQRMKMRNTGGASGSSGGFDVATDAFSNITTSYPSNTQGYGRVQLNEVLHFANASRNPLSLFVMGGTDKYNSSFLATGATTKTYTFTTGPEVPQPVIRVSMAYTDYYTTSGSSNAMVNVLSMSVAEVDGNAIYTPYTPSNTASNTPVKVIDIRDAKANTKYTITVSASTLSRSPQAFALVVTGTLTFLDAENPENGETYGPDYPFIAYSTQNQIIALGIVFLVLVVFYFFIKSHTKKRKSVKVNTWKFNSKADKKGGRNNNATSGAGYHDYGELGISEDEERGRAGGAGGGSSLFRSLFYKDPVQQAIEESRRDEAARRKREQREQREAARQHAATPDNSHKKSSSSSQQPQAQTQQQQQRSNKKSSKKEGAMMVEGSGHSSGHHPPHSSSHGGGGGGQQQRGEGGKGSDRRREKEKGSGSERETSDRRR